MSRNFKEWLETFCESINSYKYYTDFNKVYKNAERVKIEISILNSLIGSKQIERDFDNLIERYPECLKAIPIMLAVREYEIYCQDEKGSIKYRFDKPLQTKEEYKYFMRETGLFDMLENHIINNLYDYIMGVEVGLGSNGRKNRGGSQMEELVEKYIEQTGAEYYSQMPLTEIEKRWNIDLSAISNKGSTEKIWDFVIKTNDKLYVMETNFYTSGGSKLNETARSYKMIAEEVKDLKEIEFIWITDGKGWISARGNLEETFDKMKHLYNINDMKNGVLKKLFE